jgi:hypothetical protein
VYPPLTRDTTEAVPEMAGYALLPHPMKDEADDDKLEADDADDEELTVLNPRPEELSAKAIADPLSAAYF